MKYSENEKKFYELMQKKREEINDLDISENEKNSLYQLVDENIQVFEKGKISLETNYKLIKALDNMDKGLQAVISANITMKKELPNLEKAAFKLRIEKSIKSQKPLIN